QLAAQTHESTAKSTCANSVSERREPEIGSIACGAIPGASVDRRPQDEDRRFLSAWASEPVLAGADFCEHFRRIRAGHPDRRLDGGLVRAQEGVFRELGRNRR